MQAAARAAAVERLVGEVHAPFDTIEQLLAVGVDSLGAARQRIPQPSLFAIPLPLAPRSLPVFDFAPDVTVVEQFVRDVAGRVSPEKVVEVVGDQASWDRHVAYEYAVHSAAPLLTLGELADEISRLRNVLLNHRDGLIATGEFEVPADQRPLFADIIGPLYPLVNDDGTPVFDNTTRKGLKNVRPAVFDLKIRLLETLSDGLHRGSPLGFQGLFLSELSSLSQSTIEATLRADRAYSGINLRTQHIYENLRYIVGRSAGGITALVCLMAFCEKELDLGTWHTLASTLCKRGLAYGRPDERQHRYGCYAHLVETPNGSIGKPALDRFAERLGCEPDYWETARRTFADWLYSRPAMWVDRGGRDHAETTDEREPPDDDMVDEVATVARVSRTGQLKLQSINAVELIEFRRCSHEFHVFVDDVDGEGVFRSELNEETKNGSLKGRERAMLAGCVARAGQWKEVSLVSARKKKHAGDGALQALRVLRRSLDVRNEPSQGTPGHYRLFKHKLGDHGQEVCFDPDGDVKFCVLLPPAPP